MEGFRGEGEVAFSYLLCPSLYFLPLHRNLGPIKLTLTFATSVMWHLSTPSTLPWDTMIISTKPSEERDFIPPLTDRERQKEGEGKRAGYWRITT